MLVFKFQDLSLFSTHILVQDFAGVIVAINPARFTVDKVFRKAH